MDGLGGEILVAWKRDDESKDVERKGIDMSIDGVTQPQKHDHFNELYM
jgi:hypothetical protein